MTYFDEATLHRRYHLDETTGTNIADTSGAGKDGTTAGTVTLNSESSPAYPGTAAAPLFGGTSSDKVTADALDMSIGGNAWSISCWVKWSAAPANFQQILYNQDAGGRKFWLGFQYGELRLFFDNGTSSFALRADEAATTDATHRGDWIHIAATVWGTSHSFAALYINGSAVTGVGAGTSIDGATEGFIIGEDFPANIAQVEFYMGRLSALEVQQIYTDQALGAPSGLKQAALDAFGSLKAGLTNSDGSLKAGLLKS